MLLSVLAENPPLAKTSPVYDTRKMPRHDFLPYRTKRGIRPGDGRREANAEAGEKEARGELN